MTHARTANRKIPTVSPQLAPDKSSRPAPVGPEPAPVSLADYGGLDRSPGQRGGDEVIEFEYGITVYPARGERARWRAVWYEDGQRCQCEASSEERLAVKLQKVSERLAAGAPGMKRPGADLIAYYLDPDRLPVTERWSRKHAHTQARLCERFAVPVIAAITCEDIKASDMQQIVNAAPTPGEGDRVRRMISAMVTAGIDGGYLANPRLAKIHWQAGNRPLPPPKITAAGESALWVDPAEIPARGNVTRLAQALASGRHGDRDELMAYTAAYTGLRWGELVALTIPRSTSPPRVITVDRKIIEVAGHLYVEAPKNRKNRKTIYPRQHPRRLPPRRPARRPHPASPPPSRPPEPTHSA